MKKLLFLTLTLSIFMLSACSTEVKTTNNLNLEQEGLRLIDEVDSLAENQEYINLFGSSPEITTIIKQIGNGDYATPQAVFVVENLDEMVLNQMLMGESLSKDVYDVVKGRFASALPSQINAMSGVNNVAATSILSHSSSFLYDGLTAPTTYIYTFDSEYSYMVSFVPTTENIVNGYVTVVINDQISSCRTNDEVTDFFQNSLNFGEVSVSEVAKEK